MAAPSGTEQKDETNTLPTYLARALVLRYRFTDGTLLMADPRASYDGNTHSMFAWVRRDSTTN